MSGKHAIFVILIITALIPAELEAQVWPFRRRSQAERATRDLERRQRETGQQTNFFNPLQPFGSRRNNDRDDHIWSPETAYLSIPQTGNVSITNPSRLGINSKYELQSLLGASYWVPNLMIKRRIHSGEIYWATRHGIYVPTPGLNWAQNKGYHSYVDTTAAIPHIVAIRNELIVSKPFMDDVSCVQGIPWLIITAGLSADYGLSLESNDLSAIDEHIIGSRSAPLTGKGLLIIARLRADARLNDFTFIEGGFRYFNSTHHNNGFEHHAALNYFAAKNFSISPGYLLSIGNFGSSKVKIYPSLDLTWYFGQKSRRGGRIFEGSRF
ncbi:hypothetical protein [Natronoflexus pectinivorans]|uniref:Type IX secretion system PorP/SprF family membrane protein n=1 Tax=Natronoflexus pectinivorans TaxID=682526 RepID=A0A4R2GQA0_9BACT|nr:hypothetical protein [Natronoflexus pectinivorans]TCO10899.1 hypothetical protein EV194_101533 [Natronoflexus pectinivorans]